MYLCAVELGRPALIFALSLVGGAAACDRGPELGPTPARPAGLIPRAQVEQPTPSPHLTELARFGDYVYVGNSNDQIAVYRLEPDGGLRSILGATGPSADNVRCTTLAIHEPTRSLYCASDAGIGVARFDLGDPAAPDRALEPFELPADLRASDMVVVADELLLARYDRGLAVAQIDGAGRLSAALDEQPELGNLARLDADAGGRVWALSRDRGLLVLERDSSGTWAERWRLPASELDGPALGLDVDGSRAALGLGSGGLAIVELDPSAGLRRTHLLEPPGVVSAAALRGDAAIAVSLFGAFAYDLRAPERWPEDPRGEQPRAALDEGGARLAGFIASGPWDHPGGGGAMLDGLLFERDGALELLVSDWAWVERVAVDLDGFPRGVDLRGGEWLAADAEAVALAVRNPTAFATRVEVQRVGARESLSVELGPRETATIELPAADFEIDTPQLVLVHGYDGDERISTRGVTVMRRPPLAGWPVADYGRPAAGAEFPELTLATAVAGETVAAPVPIPGVTQRLVFYGIDCAAMWPEVEDLLWRVRSGRLERDAVVLASHLDPRDDARVRWGLDAARWAYFEGPSYPEELRAQNPFADLYDDGFVIWELPSAAHHPTDYLIGPDGRVALVEREYRGEWGFMPNVP